MYIIAAIVITSTVTIVSDAVVALVAETSFTVLEIDATILIVYLQFLLLSLKKYSCCC